MKRIIFSFFITLFISINTNCWAIDECRQHSFDGYAQPCPVLNVDDRTMIDQTFEVELTPSSESHFILSTVYILNNNQWQPYRFDVNEDWITEQTLNTLDPQEQGLDLGHYYMASWDWTWDAEAGCYKGAGLNQCETGQWRITVFQVQQDDRQSVDDATYVVSQDGTGDFETIQDAVDVAQAGDHVLIKEGIYYETIDMVNDGSDGRPIVFEGERGANGEYKTIIDGGEEVTANWSHVDSGVYRARLGFNPGIITVNGKQIARLNQEEMGDGTGMEILRREREYVVRNGDQEYFSANVDVVFWDIIHAVYGYNESNEYTYIRFRDGEDPGDLTLSAGSDNFVLDFTNKSYITFKNVKVQSGEEAVHMEGERSHHNIVENCFLVNGRKRVDIFEGANNNKIRNNEITMNFYGTDFGPWSSENDNLAQAHHHLKYTFYKRVVGTSASDDYNIRLRSAGDNNEISGNKIYGGLIGINFWGIDRVSKGHRIFDNVIFDHSSTGMTIIAGQTDSYYYNNLVYNNNSNMRIHRLSDRNHREVFIFNNRIHNPPGIGNNIFLHWNDGSEATPSNQPDVYIYHNSVAGGGSAVGFNGRQSFHEGAPNFYFVNNVFASGRTVKANKETIETESWVGFFDYNWSHEYYGSYGAPEWLGSHNQSSDGESLWTGSALPDFRINESSNAYQTGLDLSRIQDVGGEDFGRFNYEGTRVIGTLPGMTRGYFSGDRPSMGAFGF